MSLLAISLLVRLLVFVGVFAYAAHKHPKITITPRYAVPLVGLVFAGLNTALYWALKTVISLATLGAASLVLPLVLNGLFLWATARVLKPLNIEGTRPMVWLAVLLTAAHGALFLVFDVIL